MITFFCLNTFQFGSKGDWGEKANKDLKFVKGEILIPNLQISLNSIYTSCFCFNVVSI